MFILITLLYLLSITLSDNWERDDCAWFGYFIDTPIFPMYVCNTFVDEPNRDEGGLVKYSTSYECEEGGETMLIKEWNNTDCNGEEYAITTYSKDDGWYFNCPPEIRFCPYTTVRLYALVNNSVPDDHVCTIDNHRYEEFSVITDYCMDFSDAFGTEYSYYVDCSAHSVQFTSYSDDHCEVKNSSIVIEEGCDDPYNWDAYVMVRECNDDGDIINSNTLAPTPSPSSSSDTTTVIIVVAIAVIIIVAAILIGAFIIRNKRMGAGMGSINSGDSKQQPLSFDRLGDDQTDAQ